MSGATCPACGVAVLPGYARCPKCRAPLHFGSQTRAGGTSLEETRLPILPLVAVGVIAIGIVVGFGVRASSNAPATAAIPTTTGQVVVPPAVVAPVAEAAAPAATAPTAGVSAAELERALRKQRLWSTVEVLGDHVVVRSGSCLDAGIGPIIDAAAAALKSGGLTKLRCLEQSGRVVFERDF